MPAYLALGDSYTIGEGVEPENSFPHQLQRTLNVAGLSFDKPVIVAQTGWTTGELLSAIEKAGLKPGFDLVTLLIGVNNQYRGLAIEQYQTEFAQLLTHAIAFAGGNPSAVYVMSIPDWSATPFAIGRNRENITREIVHFNAINFAASKEHGANYVAITHGTGVAITDSSLLTSDNLHPSANEYARWAKKLAERLIAPSITKTTRQHEN